MSEAAAELQAAEEIEQALGTVTNTVTIKGKEIQVRPLEAQQLSDILKKVYALKNLAAFEVEVEVVRQAAAAVEDGEDAADAVALTEAVRELVTKIDYVKLFMMGGDEVLDILRIGTYQRAEVVKTLNVVELVALAKKFVEVNVDFFLSNLPAIQEMFGVVKEAGSILREVSPEPSGDSPTTATE